MNTVSNTSATRTLRMIGGPAHGKTVQLATDATYYNFAVAVPMSAWERRNYVRPRTAITRYTVASITLRSENNVGVYTETVAVAQDTTLESAALLLHSLGVLAIQRPVVVVPPVFAEIEVEDSEMVAKIGYAPKETTLRITFKKIGGEVGSTYEYKLVPAGLFAEFLVAPSKGKFFNANIKGVYSSRKVS